MALAYQGITYTTREKVVDLGPLKITAINAVGVIVVVVWLLQAFGVLGALRDVRIR